MFFACGQIREGRNQAMSVFVLWLGQVCQVPLVRYLQCLHHSHMMTTHMDIWPLVRLLNKVLLFYAIRYLWWLRTQRLEH